MGGQNPGIGCVGCRGAALHPPKIPSSRAGRAGFAPGAAAPLLEVLLSPEDNPPVPDLIQRDPRSQREPRPGCIPGRHTKLGALSRGEAGVALCTRQEASPGSSLTPKWKFYSGKEKPGAAGVCWLPSPAPRISSCSASTRKRISAGGSPAPSQPEHGTGISGRGTKAARGWGWQCQVTMALLTKYQEGWDQPRAGWMESFTSWFFQATIPLLSCADSTR